MAEDRKTVGGQPVIDNVPLQHECNGASDFCRHCSVDLCGNDPRANEPCMGLESARRSQINPSTIVAFGCDREANGVECCAQWCQGVKCAYTRGVPEAQAQQLAYLSPEACKQFADHIAAQRANGVMGTLKDKP